MRSPRADYTANPKRVRFSQMALDSSLGRFVVLSLTWTVHVMNNPPGNLPARPNGPSGSVPQTSWPSACWRFSPEHHDESTAKCGATPLI